MAELRLGADFDGETYEADETDLFGERPEQPIKGGYRGIPGAGPPDQTCGTCRYCYYRSRRNPRRYYKCALVAPTSGPGTDIRLKTPACQFWEKQENRNGSTNIQRR